MATYDDVPDEILQRHVIPKLNASDRLMVFSRVHRRTRALGFSTDQPQIGGFINSATRRR
jgi:hypothetical protein